MRQLWTRNRWLASALVALFGAGCSDGGVDGNWSGNAPDVEPSLAPDVGESIDTTDTNAPETSAPADLKPFELDGAGRVVFDADGIPHIYAHTDADAFLLQGWAAASQRIYQMDLTRRRAHGRRAEVLGVSMLQSDLLARALRFSHWAERTEEALATQDPELLSFFQAYAAGVNAWLQAAERGEPGVSYPPQFDALGYRPEPWSAIDTLAIEKMIAAGLSMRPDQDITLGLIHQLLGQDFYEDLYIYPDFEREYVVPGFYDSGQSSGALHTAAGPLQSSEALQMRAESRLAATERLAQLVPSELLQALHATKQLRLSEGGSNNWTISGELTQSGAPIIAGDSHQGVFHPSVYYFVHLNSTQLEGASGKLDVIGASFPGVPFVVFGHNGVAGFMPTTSILDQADSYLESFNSTEGTVRFMGKDVPVESRIETILVREQGAAFGKNEQKAYTLRDVPHHGPMLPTEAIGLPLPLTVSIRWTGYRPRSLGRAFYQINLAQNWPEFRAALEHMNAGGQHWVYADVHGDIGYSCRVDLPQREVVDPSAPPTRLLPGEGGYEWLAGEGGAVDLKLVPNHLIPWVLNPPRGFVTSANNDPAGVTDDGNPYDAPAYLSGLFDIGTRARRPRERIEALAAKKLNLAEVADIQLDNISRLGVALVPYILNAAKGEGASLTPKHWEAIETLGTWDHRCDVDSRACLLFHAWLATFTRVVLEDEANGLLANFLFNELDPRIGLVVTKFIEHWLRSTRENIHAIEDGSEPFGSATGLNFFDDQRTPDVVETRDEMIIRALDQALVELEQVLAPLLPEGADPSDQSQWRWGLWHTMQLVDPAEQWLPGVSSPMLEKDGGLYTVDVADFNWLEAGKLPARAVVKNAASNRFVVEMKPNGVEGLAILPGGQDERPSSPFHNDQFEDFVRGRFRPLRHRLADVEANAHSTHDFPAAFGPEVR